MKHPALLIPLLLLLASCSCQQRLNRLARNCPECFTRDTFTLTRIDTVVPPPILISDTVPWPLILKDTVFITHPDYSLTLSPSPSGLAINGQATPDTIILVDTLFVDRPIPLTPKNSPQSPWHWAVLITLALFALWGLLATVKNK